MLARRVRPLVGDPMTVVEEALVQWESCWVDADVVHEYRIVEVLLRRTVHKQNEMLVQWACTWEPVDQVDEGALADFDGEVAEVPVNPAPLDQSLGTGKPKKKAKQNCVVIARRVRDFDGDRTTVVEEALVQWENCWVDADVVHEYRIVEVLLRRTVRDQNEMLVQWACTWEPVDQVDEGALADFDGEVAEVPVNPAPVDQSLGTEKPKKKLKRRTTRRW